MNVTRLEVTWPARFEITRDQVIEAARPPLYLTFGSISKGNRWFYFKGIVARTATDILVGCYENKLGYGVWFTLQGKPVGCYVESMINQPHDPQ